MLKTWCIVTNIYFQQLSALIKKVIIQTPAAQRAVSSLEATAQKHMKSALTRRRERKWRWL
jgi:hypothetical protein